MLRHEQASEQFLTSIVDVPAVLDEADRLLSDTFAEHLEMILQHIPQRRQTLLFSATMSINENDLERVGCSTTPFKCEVSAKYA